MLVASNFDDLLHPAYFGIVSMSAKSDYLEELESEINKEYSDLLKILKSSRQTRRVVYLLKPFGSKPFGFKIFGYPEKAACSCSFYEFQGKGYLLKTVNLIVKFKEPCLEPTFTFKELLLDTYFELYGKETKFSNTDTLCSSRSYERYLSMWIGTDTDDSNFDSNSSNPAIQSESRWKINVFDFTYYPIPLEYIESSTSIRMYPQMQKVDTKMAEFYLEVLFELSDQTEFSEIKYLRTKNSDFNIISSQTENYWIQCSGYCVGLILSFETIESKKNYKLDQDYIPDLISVGIFTGSETELNEPTYSYESDTIVSFKTPEFKYSVLIFDPSRRSPESIKDILDGYVYNSEKIQGINFRCLDDPPVNTNLFSYDEQDAEYSDQDNDEYSLPEAYIKFTFESGYDYSNNPFKYYINCIYLDVV